MRSFTRGLSSACARAGRRSLLLRRGLLGRALLARDLRALAAGFGEADGDRLLAARHFLSRAAGLQLALLALAHRPLDFLSRLFSVLAHETSCADNVQDLNRLRTKQELRRERCPAGA